MLCYGNTSFIGKPRKPCCGQGMKVALVVRHSQQQIVRLPAVPIGKQAQIRNVVVGHLSVGPANMLQRAECAPLLFLFSHPLPVGRPL